MTFRVVISCLLLLLFIFPLTCVVAETFVLSAWAVWLEGSRIVELAQHTFALLILTLLFAFPPGFVLALLLQRTNLPGRNIIHTLVLVGLFVPLPLVISAWQAVGGDLAQQWNQGVWWAAFVHAVTALPWVVWLVGLGLARVEPELEEEALTATTPFKVLLRVSIPRAKAAIQLAVLWIVLQTIGEIAVTDMANVRTFAEEIYTQYVVGGPEAQARAVIVSLPVTVLGILGCGFVLRQWHRETTISRWKIAPLMVELGRWRWLLSVLVVGGVLVCVGVPLFALIRQAGGHHSGGWSAVRFKVEMLRALKLNAGMLGESLCWSIATGCLATLLATLAGWLALERLAFRRFLFLLVVILWAVPGPVLGFGLKEAINRLMDIEDVLLGFSDLRPARALLYEWSTPLPVLWAHLARLFPFAVALLWPALQAIPRDLRDLARVDGAGLWAEFRHVIWPHVRRVVPLAIIAVTALALGELSTSKLVQVPGRQTFAQELFKEMHYGVTTTTAALALVELGMVGVIGLLLKVKSNLTP